ncbi:hypothetical protein Patl1_02670 [Pistacia atlantica]|uniref:Uncharacterized protein n=1 Tax=Pistacia atlantica TaxID=434234 RepID=A0ACC1C8M9_9ROSI|nr:hypothetical protein Patl1_02670 [Pistacia atlantica]
MADHNHHRHHRPHRLSVPLRPSATFNTTTPTARYPPFPYPSSTPTSTPSKLRSLSFPSKPSNKSSLSFLFLILFSLRSLYSLLPFLRSSPSFSLFPFTFLVSLLSFLLSLSFTIFSYPSSKQQRFSLNLKQHQSVLSFSLISPAENKFLFTKSFVLALVFLLRFQALRYCGTAAMILAELSGNVTGRFLAEARKNQSLNDWSKFSRLRGFLCLFLGLLLLSISWDRIECFPFSSSLRGSSMIYGENCVRVWPMLLPFLAGFLGCYERVSMNWGTIRQLNRKQVRLISLFYTTIFLFIPAVVSWIVFEKDGEGVSIANLAWPLANTVVFGVLLSENYSDEKLVSSTDFQREFLVTSVCTIVLELFYYPELSLFGLVICLLLLYFAIRELDPLHWNYLQLGFESSESFSSSIMKPIHHILSERKSRKIALFLLINTGYMVVEFVAGFMSNSLGLISDACHMLFDCGALAIGLYASYISRLPANNQFNYGRGRFEVLSGYVNAVFLVLVGALIVLESLERILDPQEISTNSLLTVSIGGLVVNVIGLIFFHEEHHHAHGGGSCSHSHSHSHSHAHSHSHSHHDHQHSHDQEGHSKHQECISISHGSSEKCCSLKDDHHGNFHATYQHDHHEGTHKQELPRGHAHEDLSHGHDHHDHSHGHDHHDQSHEHDHHDHSHGRDHHDHQSLLHISSRSLQNHSNEEPQKHRHQHIDHNMEGIFLHVLADTMGSVGVVISTLLIKYKGWLVADPACSIFISVLIVSSVIPLLRNSAELLLQRVPRAHELDLKEALNDVVKVKGVCGIQNLHVWSLTNTDVVGTLHLHISKETDKAFTKAQVSHILHDAGIKDLTLQVECVK